MPQPVLIFAGLLGETGDHGVLLDRRGVEAKIAELERDVSAFPTMENGYRCLSKRQAPL